MMWCITISPKEDISDERVELFVKWTNKHGRYFRVITEKTEQVKRHLHSIIVFKAPKRKDWIKVSLKALLNMTTEEYNAFKSFRFSRGAKVEAIHTAYDDKYYSEYLNKDDLEEVILDNWDPDAVHEYYVPKAEMAGAEAPDHKFRVIYTHYNGEKALGPWYRGLIVQGVIAWSFVPRAQIDFFLSLFREWVNYQEKPSEDEGPEVDQGSTTSD